MKRVQLIEIGILVVALVVGFNAIQAFFDVLVVFLYQTTSDMGYTQGWSFIFRYMIVALFYLAAFLFLIKKTKWLAFYIDRQGRMTPEILSETPEMVPIRIQQTSLLFISLVVLCIASIITRLPALLFYIYDYFKTNVGGSKGETDFSFHDKQFIDFKAAAVTIIINIVILIFARPIAERFTRQPGSDKIVIETGTAS